MQVDFSTNPITSYSLLVQYITEAADLFIPSKKPHSKNLSSPPWWDAECTTMIKRRKAAEKLYNHCMTTDNFIQFQKTSAQTRRLLSKKKKNGWKKFCESLSPNSPVTIVWKNIKKFRGSLLSDSNISDNSLPWLEVFSDMLAPPFVPNEYTICPPIPVPSYINNNEIIFSLSELQSVLSGLKSSSPGEDGIPYACLCKLSLKGKLILLQILNNIYISSNIPLSWSNQIVIPILKPGKDPKEASSYRPIALSSTFCKILEHLIKNRLEWFLEHNNILAKSQFGFRKGKSTLDSLSILTTDIRLAFSKNEYLVGCFLDISSAYDSVLLPVLRQKMLHLNIPAKTVHFIYNLFMGRSIKIRNKGMLTSPRTIWKGLPQGSVLSPILYNIYIYDLEHSISSFCDILQYADDLAIYVTAPDILTASHHLNRGLYYLNQWLTDHGLSLSASKSKTITFSRKRVFPTIDISYNGESIPVVNKVKFLGIFLDCHMTGTAHFNYICDKCEKGVNILRSLSGVWWGSHPMCQKILYNAIIRSHFDYGSFLLEPCNKSALNRLDVIQARCLRIITGAMKSTPKNALQVECADPPLSLRRQFLADRFLSKTLQLSSHPLHRKLESLLLLAVNNSYWFNKSWPPILKSLNRLKNIGYPCVTSLILPYFETSYEAILINPKITLNLNINKNSPTANRTFYNLVAKKWSDWLYIFTDASKLSPFKCVGSAVWIPKYKIVLNYRCPPQASVFTGEAVAIYEAISYILSHKIPKSVIFTDSKSCLMSLQSNIFKMNSISPLILKIKELILNCNKSGLDVEIVWIPSHCGIEGNEQADSWAKGAVDTGCPSHLMIYSHDLMSLAQIELKNSWNREWSTSRHIKGCHFGKIQPQIPPKPWFFKFSFLNKQITSTICRLRLGHACTPVFLAKIRIKDHSLCECGLDEGTPDHIFFNCQNHPISLYDILPNTIPRPMNINSLLTIPNSIYVNMISKYIQMYNIKL
ncbi:unnamed protein product [Parnassius mnemosyne]|uniref:RNA-directed DNA polymerase from mobile element jockey n=1 Tax=Parnassius mnemosyne TaxID=213953 RepID=A0AAV1LPJ2_9NEOP